MTAPLQGHSALLLRPLARVLGRLDIDAERFLLDVGIDDATSDDAYVPALKVERALQALAAERSDPTFALTLAREAAVRPLGLFGHIVWLSGTLRDAFERAARFYSLVTGRATLSLEEHVPQEESGLAVLTRRERGSGAGGTILIEFAFASFALRARAATEGRFRPRAMRFSQAARTAGDARPYEAFFEAPVVFGAELDQLVLDAAQLDLRLSSADPVTAAVILAQANPMVARLAARSTLVDQVRRAAAAEPLASRPSLRAIARRVGVGARSLGRRLAVEEAVTLREIVESVRRERASELLAAGTPVKEVAFLLGFSEPSAFSRAYKRWTGEAPSARRT
jgi:AraC-like DNA-binding protein